MWTLEAVPSPSQLPPDMHVTHALRVAGHNFRGALPGAACLFQASNRLFPYMDPHVHAVDRLIDAETAFGAGA